MKNDKAEINDTELEAVTGGTEPGEWSIPENGLPRPNGRYSEPESDTPVWTVPTEDNKVEFEVQEPGTYEVRGVVYGG